MKIPTKGDISKILYVSNLIKIQNICFRKPYEFL